MYTEDKAKTKWCPHALLPGEEPGVSYNRHHLEASDFIIQHGTNCIASDCMMWQWDENNWQCPECSTWFNSETICHEKTTIHKQNGHCGLTK